MNKDLKAKWIAALRSGDYKQGRVFLEHGDGFCCMGVLCKVIGTSTNDIDGRLSGDVYAPVAAVLGDDLDRNDINATWMRRLADLNDYKGKSFAEIADWIEQHIPAE